VKKNKAEKAMVREYHPFEEKGFCLATLSQHVTY
jgi:hypothetical protein